MLAHANEGFRDYALLPVFLLRQFRHKSVFVRTDAGIATPQDLRGRRVGMPGYSSTSLTWIRGIFQEEYGLRPEEIEWVVANKDSSAGEAGKISEQEQQAPEGIPISQGTPGLDESELLLAGEVDALFHAATPAAYVQGDPRISRLFPDFRSVEQDYFRRTGVFPIMHVLAIRRDTALEHPWLPRAAFNAYSRAKIEAYKTKDRLTWATDMLPWYSQELENTTPHTTNIEPRDLFHIIARYPASTEYSIKSSRCYYQKGHLGAHGLATQQNSCNGSESVRRSL